MIEITGRVRSVWQRNLDAFLRTYRVNFIPPFIEPVLYLLALGFGLGTYIETVDGIPYPVFIAPALVSISVMYSSFFECTYSSFVRMYYQKTFDAIIATPVSIDEVIAGEMLWGATRGMIYATLMLPVLLIFGVVAMPSSLLLIPFAFLAGLLFASIGMCFTAITPGIDALNYPSFLFITPMFLFSGTFFPLDLLPEPIQYFAFAALPLTHVVSINRAITLPAFSPTNLFSLAWIAAATVLFFLLAIRLMRRRLIV
ncbi:ABC transporter permease [Methanoculleus bourgensis]|jgi:lipooligosaccharide transport system permease protein|uniref:ABC transporter permease n=1 Tax=Methanoculleus bourgensis TaxID=83986 RepID=A0A0X3BNC9_9EURY|nr:MULTISPECIES: ABC transporter permease [Methanoculleus]MBT0732257.1 ABC transporter permease [Methanoculleus bourgensis]NMA89140.1 ABC transporter permease [Methanoculleus bourgensis]NQS79277.1 ABC transporter permease [Methanoculleus bourgensis]CVK33501.1 Nodulation protein J [Methanoculleus bourgensis]SAI88854.1 ABC-type multidrug transport system, permease component [Methanoculleus bourgensis]